MYERVPMNGLGWSDVPESPSLTQWLAGTPTATKMCLENTGGQQRCFAESENQIAIDNNCERMNLACGGGSVWCCPRGFPESASTTNPGYVPTSTRVPGVLVLLAAGTVLAGAWYVMFRARSEKALTEPSRWLREAI